MGIENIFKNLNAGLGGQMEGFYGQGVDPISTALLLFGSSLFGNEASYDPGAALRAGLTSGMGSLQNYAKQATEFGQRERQRLDESNYRKSLMDHYQDQFNLTQRQYDDQIAKTEEAQKIVQRVIENIEGISPEKIGWLQMLAEVNPSTAVEQALKIESEFEAKSKIPGAAEKFRKFGSPFASIIGDMVEGEAISPSEGLSAYLNLLAINQRAAAAAASGSKPKEIDWKDILDEAHKLTKGYERTRADGSLYWMVPMGRTEREVRSREQAFEVALDKASRYLYPELYTSEGGGQGEGGGKGTSGKPGAAGGTAGAADPAASGLPTGVVAPIDSPQMRPHQETSPQQNRWGSGIDFWSERLTPKGIEIYDPAEKLISGLLPTELAVRVRAYISTYRTPAEQLRIANEVVKYYASVNGNIDKVIDAFGLM